MDFSGRRRLHPDQGVRQAGRLARVRPARQWLAKAWQRPEFIWAASAAPSWPSRPAGRPAEQFHPLGERDRLGRAGRVLRSRRQGCRCRRLRSVPRFGPRSQQISSRRPGASIAGQHVDREVHGDRTSAPGGERGADRSGASAGVGDRAPGERMRAHRDQFRGDRAAGQRGAGRPPPACAGMIVSFHPATPGAGCPGGRRHQRPGPPTRPARRRHRAPSPSRRWP